MGRWDPYSRRELRKSRVRWLLKHLKLVTLATTGLALAAAMLTWCCTQALSDPAQWYVSGAVHVGLAAGLLHLLNSAFLASDQHAIWHVRGAWGEKNTRDELGRARRRRLIWGWVDSITLNRGDIDHLAIARKGGLVVMDSKWRNTITRDDITVMAQSAIKARMRAEGVAQTVHHKERGEHRARAQPLTVTPVVVIWGAAQASVPKDAVVDGVRFVAGSDLLAWLRTLDGDPVPKESAADMCDRLKSYRSSAWHGAQKLNEERQTQPGKPRSAERAPASRSAR